MSNSYQTAYCSTVGTGRCPQHFGTPGVCGWTAHGSLVHSHQQSCCVQQTLLCLQVVVLASLCGSLQRSWYMPGYLFVSLICPIFRLLNPAVLILQCGEVYTGQALFQGMTVGQVFYMVVYEGHRPPIPETCPQGYSQLMQSCWHADMNERYQSLVHDRVCCLVHLGRHACLNGAQPT